MARTLFIRQSFTLRDNTGNTGRTSFWMGVDTAVGNEGDLGTIAALMKTAIGNASNAKIVGSSGVSQGALDPSQYGVQAQYNNVEDKARLSFLAASRLRSTSLQVPAPLLALFFSAGAGTGGDEETVNPANAQVVALLAAMTTISNSAAVTAGPFDDLIHSLVLGKLRRVKARRKIGRWTKDPTGTIPA